MRESESRYQASLPTGGAIMKAHRQSGWTVEVVTNSWRAKLILPPP